MTGYEVFEIALTVLEMGVRALGLAALVGIFYVMFKKFNGDDD